MLYGIGKIGVMGGHGDGANAIPAEFATNSVLKAYREGTKMHELADELGKIPGIVNLRTEAADVSWAERAQRIQDAGCDMGIELHTNWSLNSAGQPNSNIFLVIVALYNPVHGVEEQKAMAIQLFKPLADAMGMTFQIRTKKGGGEWDWYSFLNECNRQRIPYPFIVEYGYHIDYASNESLFKQLIVARYKEIAEYSAPGTVPDEPAPVDVVDETEPHSYIVYAGLFNNKENAAETDAFVKSKGYSTWLQNRNGVYVLRTALNKNINYAIRDAEKLASLGLESGFIII